MGKKKAFINKKNATTYTLVFRSTEEQEAPTDEEGDRVLVPTGELGGGDREGAPPSDPRALYAHFFGDDDEHEEGTSEARRRELLELGFPDDGYDYLKHCRVVGRGSAAMQANPAAAHAASRPPADASGAGSSSAAAAAAVQQGLAAAAAAAQPSQSVFLQAPRVRAPDADVKLIDARRVAVAAPAAAAAGSSSATAAAAAAGSTDLPSPPAAVTGAAVLAVPSEAAAPAAARKLGGRELAADLVELEQLMAEAEAASEAGEAGEEGLGDLLDDFVITAAAGDAGEQQQQEEEELAAVEAGAAGVSGAVHHLSDEDEDEEFSSEISDYEGEAAAGTKPQQQQRAPAAAVGSSGRAAAAAAAPVRAGNAAYDMLNEQFDHLVSAYADEQLGDLEGDERAAGKLGPAQLQALVQQGQRVRIPMLAGDGELHNEDAEGEEFGSEDGDEFPGSGAVGLGSQAHKVHSIGGLGFESKVESFAHKDEAVIAAVRARLAAQEAAAAAAAAAGKEGSGRGAAGGILEDEELANVYLPERERWDCESVLSMRSSASHFPAKIASEGPRRQRSSAAAVAAGGGSAAGGIIKLNYKTGLPSGYGAASMAAAAAAASAAAAAAAAGGASVGGGQQRLTSAAVAAAAAEDGSDGSSEGAGGFDECSMATSIYERPKGETAEERKARKAAVKALQRDARATKKQLKQMYAAEATKQQRQQAAAPKSAVFAIP